MLKSLQRFLLFVESAFTAPMANLIAVQCAFQKRLVLLSYSPTYTLLAKPADRLLLLCASVTAKQESHECGPYHIPHDRRGTMLEPYPVVPYKSIVGSLSFANAHREQKKNWRRHLLRIKTTVFLAQYVDSFLCLTSCALSRPSRANEYKCFPLFRQPAQRARWLLMEATCRKKTQGYQNYAA